MQCTEDDRRARPGTTAAACGYWQRRGMPTAPEQTVVAPGAPLLLLALLAATGSGAVLLPRPSAPWHAPQARLLGRPVHRVPVPVECGGVPDPVALLETARRARGQARAGGDAPHVLVLSVVDDCTGTTPPPELLHEVCEAAAGEGLLVVSDETWRDTSHDPHDTVMVSPAEMLEGTAGGDDVVVLAGVAGTLPPPVPQAGIARFPAGPRGRALADGVRRVLHALDARLPPAADAAAADALDEPEPLVARRAATARAQGVLVTALYRALTDAGALCRPPQAARHVYADLEPLRPRLAAHGITDAAGLEAELVRRLGPYVSGGQRLGDEPGALRVRLSGGLLTGGGDEGDLPGAADVPSLTPPDPLESPGAARALHAVRAALTDLTEGSPG